MMTILSDITPEERVEVDLKFLRNSYEILSERFAEADKEECILAANNIKHFIKGGVHPNAFAAILEEARELYKIRFPAPAKIENPTGEEPREALIEAGIRPYDKEIPQGTFTVIFPDGQYETVKIETMTKGKLEGKTIASFLSGPDNETSFTGFAFINGNGKVNVWGRFKNLVGSRKETAVRIILQGVADDVSEAREAYAVKSGRCSRCHKKLTVPASLYRGVGPECAKHLGLA